MMQIIRKHFLSLLKRLCPCSLLRLLRQALMMIRWHAALSEDKYLPCSLLSTRIQCLGCHWGGAH